MRRAVVIWTVAMFTLSGAAAAQIKYDAPKSTTDNLICKRSANTGLLVRTAKRCFSAKDWARIVDSQQRGARSLVGGLTDRPAPVE